MAVTFELRQEHGELSRQRTELRFSLLLQILAFFQPVSFRRLPKVHSHDKNPLSYGIITYTPIYI